MSGLTDRLALIITADGAGAIKEFNKVGAAAEKELGKTEDRTKKVGTQMQATGVAMIGAGALIVGAMVKTAEASEEANVQHLKLDNTLKNSPQLAHANKQAFLDQASALQKLTVVDDEAVIGTQALLGQFGLTQTQITDLTPLVVDLSRKMGIDLDTAAKMVGKSVDGSSGALKKAGIVVDKAAYDNDHYTATMDALRSKVGGYAEAEGKTFSGQLEITKNRLHDVAEGVGVGAVDAFNKILGPVQSVSGWFTQLDAGTQSTVGTVGAYAGVALIATGATSTLIGTVIKMKDNFGAAVQGAKGLASAVGDMGFAKAAAGAGILAVAVIGVQKDIEHVQETVKDTQTGLFGNIDFTDLEAANAKLNEAGGKINDMGSQWDRYNTLEQIAHHAEGAALDASRDQYEQHRQHLQANVDVVNRLASDLGVTRVEAEGMVKSIKVDPSSVGYDQLKEQLTGVKAGTIDATQATLELTKSGKSEEDQAKDQAKALDEARNALKAYFDQAFNTVDAERALADSQSSLTETITKNQAIQWGAFDNSTKAGRENRQAFEEVAKAALDLAQNNIKAGGDIGQNTQMVNQQIEALRKQMIAHGFSAAAVDNYIAQLNLTPGQVITQFSAPGLKDAADDAERLNRAYRENLNQAVSRAAAASVAANPSGHGSRARGGPMMAGTPYLVGEQGVLQIGGEVFVPGMSGSMIPADKAAAVAAAAGGSSSPQVIETHTHLYLDGRELISSIQRHEVGIQ